MGEFRNAYKIFLGRREGKRPLGKPRSRWKCNIKMDLKEIFLDDVVWIRLAQGRDRWWVLVKTLMNVRDS
jgi:hypothetical protein